jgi:hypothetical protein
MAAVQYSCNKSQTEILFPFLGAFEKLLKATVSSVMSVRPSVGNSLASTGRILINLDIRAFSFFFFRKCVEKIQVLLKSDKNNGYSM